MFDLGLSEIALISVIALVVLGPERLPKAMRFIGRIIGKIRHMAASLQTELSSQIEHSQLKEISETVKESAQIMQQEVSGSLNEIKQEFNQINDAGRDAWQNLPPLRTPEDFQQPTLAEPNHSLQQKSRQLRKNARRPAPPAPRLRSRKHTAKKTP